MDDFDQYEMQFLAYRFRLCGHHLGWVLLPPVGETRPGCLCWHHYSRTGQLLQNHMVLHDIWGKRIQNKFKVINAEAVTNSFLTQMTYVYQKKSVAWRFSLASRIWLRERSCRSRVQNIRSLISFHIFRMIWVQSVIQKTKRIPKQNIAKNRAATINFEPYSP